MAPDIRGASLAPLSSFVSSPLWLNNNDYRDGRQDHKYAQRGGQQDRVELHEEETPKRSQQGDGEEYPAANDIQTSIGKP